MNFRYLSFIVLLIFHVQTHAKDPLAEWAENKKEWALKKMKEGSTLDRFDRFVDYYFPDKLIPIKPTQEEKANADRTKALFHEYYPIHDPSSYVGTFFEGGHPFVTSKYGPYQWNSMGDSGMDDHDVFRTVIKTLVNQGIRSFRLAPLLHKDNQNEFLEKVRVIWEEGGTPIITMVWFPSFKKWEVKDPKGEIDYPKSYILNEKWPRDIESLTESLMTKVWEEATKIEKKSGKKLTALVNGVNEPETLAGFNRHFWHGAFANWFHQEKLRYYIISLLRIAEANVRIRMAVEKTSNGRKILFMHNEAMTPDYYPSHSGLNKYAVSKFMLGDDVLLKGNFENWKKVDLKALRSLKARKNINEVEQCFREFVLGKWNKTQSDQKTAKAYLADEFQKVKDLHLKLKETTGKTVKTNSVLYLDYYYQTEYHPLISVPALAEKLSNVAVLKEALKARDDASLFEMIKRASDKLDRDYSPQGPEGPVIPLAAKKLSEVNLKKLLAQNDYLILERLIGLRREYTFVEDPELRRRRMEATIGDDAKIIFRTDQYLEKLLHEEAKLLRSIFKVSTEDELRKKIGVHGKESIREFLEANGREQFNKLFGLNREFMIGFEPQHYARQIRAGIRHGFYYFFMNYINALRLFTVGVGESGTPYYYFANLLHNQVMMEYVTALKSGVNGTQYVFGPAVDTVGWARSPLGHHWDEDHEVNPSGILRIENKQPKWRGNEAIGERWAIDFMKSVFSNMKDN